jgi:hypothetical protein
MRIVRINTTAYREEDFFLLTTLDDKQIVEVIYPIVQEERNEEGEYDNDMLVDALKKEFQLEFVEMYDMIPTLEI